MGLLVLQAFNGRDVLRDAYEEALDLATYLRQCIEERDRPRKTLTLPSRTSSIRSRRGVATEVPEGVGKTGTAGRSSILSRTSRGLSNLRAHDVSPLDPNGDVNVVVQGRQMEVHSL